MIPVALELLTPEDAAALSGVGFGTPFLAAVAEFVPEAALAPALGVGCPDGDDPGPALTAQEAWLAAEKLERDAEEVGDWSTDPQRARWAPTVAVCRRLFDPGQVQPPLIADLLGLQATPRVSRAELRAAWLCGIATYRIDPAPTPLRRARELVSAADGTPVRYLAELILPDLPAEAARLLLTHPQLPELARERVPREWALAYLRGEGR